MHNRRLRITQNGSMSVANAVGMRFSNIDRTSGFSDGLFNPANVSARQSQMTACLAGFLTVKSDNASV